MDFDSDKLLKEGIEAYQKRQFHAASKIYTEILNSNPNHPIANHNMGVLLVTLGKLLKSIPYFNKALKKNPNIEQFWLSYFETLVKLNRLVQAKKILRHAKKYKIRTRTLDLMKKEINTAIKKASSEATLEATKDPPQEHLSPIIDLYKQGEFQTVISQAKRMLHNFPHSVRLYNFLGIAYSKLQEFDLALKHYEKAIQIKPDNIGPHTNMGNTLSEKGDLDGAIKSYKKALKLRPDYAEAYNNIANTLKKKGQQRAALKAYRKALEIRPDYVEALNNLGYALLEDGKQHQAAENFLKALEIKPDHTEAHRNLSMVRNYARNDTHLIQMKKLFDLEGLSQEQRCHLSFALSKAFEDLTDYSNSYAFLKIGNKIRKKNLAYNIAKDIKSFSCLKESFFNIKKYELDISWDPKDPKPIFIVGMPRSGTTLVEQIISSHSAVTGAGELSYISLFGGPIALGISPVSAKTLLSFRKKYLFEGRKRAKENPFFTDKMPQNFLYTGLIFSAFPEAKIIHVKRDPKATCWSNYKQYFSLNGLGYCYDLHDLVTYYKLYENLMNFWEQHYRDRIYNLNYEELTSHQKIQTKKLVSYLELNWDKDCLSPQKNKRSVNTASSLQVRKEVYKGSSERWLNFKPFVGDAFDKL